MDISGTPRSQKSRLLSAIAKNLFLYVLVPVLLLWVLAQPVRDAVSLSAAAVFRITPAALAAVCLNWLVYRAVRRKHPPLLVFAHGALCLMAVVITEHLALPNDHALTTVLAVVAVSLAMAALVLLCLWFASRDSKPAHAASVFIRVLLDMFLCLCAYQVARDFESRLVSRDTWIVIGAMAALVLGLNSPKILSACRRAASRRRAVGLAEGRIVQIIGETSIDSDGDAVTPYHARIQYMVDNMLYETRAEISRFTTRRFGRDAFIGRKIPVFYDPADPAGGFANRIDRHILDRQPDEATE